MSDKPNLQVNVSEAIKATKFNRDDSDKPKPISISIVNSIRHQSNQFIQTFGANGETSQISNHKNFMSNNMSVNTLNSIKGNRKNEIGNIDYQNPNFNTFSNIESNIKDKPEDTIMTSDSNTIPYKDEKFSQKFINTTKVKEEYSKQIKKNSTMKDNYNFFQDEFNKRKNFSEEHNIVIINNNTNNSNTNKGKINSYANTNNIINENEKENFKSRTHSRSSFSSNHNISTPVKNIPNKSLVKKQLNGIEKNDLNITITRRNITRSISISHNKNNKKNKSISRDKYESNLNSSQMKASKSSVKKFSEDGIEINIKTLKNFDTFNASSKSRVVSSIDQNDLKVYSEKKTNHINLEDCNSIENIIISRNLDSQINTNTNQYIDEEQPNFFNNTIKTQLSNKIMQPNIANGSQSIINSGFCISEHNLNEQHQGVMTLGSEYKSEVKETEYMEIISDKTKPNRYKFHNFNEGNDFFKFRYICRKLREIYTTGLKQILDNNLQLRSDDRQVIHFSRLFLLKIETSYFQFNMSKYLESYNLLKDSDIIDDEEEFVEVLFLFPGFDKSVLGEFLSKDKGMNKGRCMLQFFMHKLNFENTDFIFAFRFLWQTIIPPKATDLVLEIINIFTIVYEKDNPDYYGSDELYLLCSTIMALNTSLHKKIESIKPLSLEDFIKMNYLIQPGDLTHIYNDLLNTKLDFKDDYQENFVKLAIQIKTMNQEVKEKQNIVTGSNLINDDKKDNISQKQMDKNSNTSEIFTNPNNQNQDLISNNKKQFNDIKDMLKSGEKFTKYGKKGDPHERFVFLSSDEKNFYWKKEGGCSIFSKEGKIPVKELKGCYYGTQQSEIFVRNSVRKDLEPNCFSIVGTNRTLDLRHEKEEITKKWFKAVKEFIEKSQADEKLKKKTLKSSNTKIITEIWKSAILPGWDRFRPYIIGENNINKKEINKDIKNSLEQDKRNIQYLWSLGIPEFIRGKIWKILIGNKLSISEILFARYLMDLQENIEDKKDTYSVFNKINNNRTLSKINIQYQYNNQDKFGGTFGNKEIVEESSYIKEEKSNSISKDNNINLKYRLSREDVYKDVSDLNYNNLREDNSIKNFGFQTIGNIGEIRKRSIFLIENLKENNSNPLYELIMKDIEKAFLDLNIEFKDLKNYQISKKMDKINSLVIVKKTFNLKKEEENLKILEFKKEAIIVILCFKKFRQDINYQSDLTYLTLVVMLNSEDYFQAFSNLSNLIVNGFLIYYMKEDDKFIKSRLNFMDEIFKSHLPALYKQFQLFGYQTNLFFFEWIPSVFCKFFKYKTLVRIWDLFLIENELFAFEISLALLVYMEKDLRQVTFEEVKNYLFSFNAKYFEDDFFEILWSLDLKEKFSSMKEKYNLVKEKSELYETFLYENDD